jgi:hypothetical protein
MPTLQNKLEIVQLFISNAVWTITLDLDHAKWPNSSALLRSASTLASLCSPATLFDGIQ